MASSPTSGLRLFAYLASAALIAARPAGELTDAESLDGVAVAVALDQANAPYNLYSVQLYTGAVPGGQTFTAGMNGELSRASVYVQKWCTPDCPDMLLQLRSLSGEVLASATVSQAWIPQGSYNWVDVTFSTPALVAAGTQYALVMQNAQPDLVGGYDWLMEQDFASSVDSYPAGMMFQVGYSSHPNADLYFRTYVSLETSFSVVPANPTNQATATFAFSTNETGAGFVCSLDEAAFQPCTSPLTTPRLSEGSHSLRVLARDAEGNMEEAPATYSWTVDTVPPGTSFASTPEPETRLPIPTFSFSATEPHVTFECSLDEAPFDACSGVFPALGDGQHRLAVRARDEAGNVDPPAWYSWRVDTVKPEPPVLQEPTPGQELLSSKPRFLGTAEPDTTVTLLVDGVVVGSAQTNAQGVWSCVPDAALSWGAHRASALATDRAGNSGSGLSEVPFSTFQHGNYRLGCASNPSPWQAPWPWALLLLGLPRRRARP